MQTVTSKDGTKIAYDKTGQGPAVIHVSGAMGTRNDQYSTGVAQLLASISPSMTMTAVAEAIARILSPTQCKGKLKMLKH